MDSMVKYESNKNYYYKGNKDLLNINPIVIYCSREIPVSIYEASLITIQAMFDRGICIAGGWQSPMEKRLIEEDCLSDNRKLIHILAKGLDNFKLPKQLKGCMEADNLLVLSPFEHESRISVQTVHNRDQFIFNDLNITRYLFLYISKGGNLEKLYNKCIDVGKTVFLLKHSQNSHWMKDTVKYLSKEDMRGLYI